MTTNLSKCCQAKVVFRTMSGDEHYRACSKCGKEQVSKADFNACMKYVPSCEVEKQELPASVLLSDNVIMAGYCEGCVSELDTIKECLLIERCPEYKATLGFCLVAIQAQQAKTAAEYQAEITELEQERGLNYCIIAQKDIQIAKMSHEWEAWSKKKDAAHQAKIKELFQEIEKMVRKYWQDNYNSPHIYHITGVILEDIKVIKSKYLSEDK